MSAEIAKIIRHYEGVSPYIVRDACGKFEGAFRLRESAIAYAAKLASDFGQPYYIDSFDIGEPLPVSG